MSEPPPSLTERRPGLPPAVDQVIATALAKSPSGRYQRCGEFAAALREACGLPAPRGESLPPGQTPPHPPTEVARPVEVARAGGGRFGRAADRGGGAGVYQRDRRGAAAELGPQLEAVDVTNLP
jgi:serine/threonine-protein kinase